MSQPGVHVQVSMENRGVRSEANVTDIHEALHFDHVHGRSNEEARYSSFGIWSLRWAADGREIVAGTGDASLYLFDVALGKVGATGAACSHVPASP